MGIAELFVASKRVPMRWATRKFKNLHGPERHEWYRQASVTLTESHPSTQGTQIRRHLKSLSLLFKSRSSNLQVVLTLQFLADGLPFSDSVRLQVPQERKKNMILSDSKLLTLGQVASSSQMDLSGLNIQRLFSPMS